MALTAWFLLACLASTTLASTDDQVNANIDAGTFQNPASIVRPRFRFWLPDSSIDAETLKEDIKSAASIGAGGVEFLPYFGYGGQMNAEPPGADWAKSGFGTPQFVSIFQAALEAHRDSGLKMDFAVGPNQGQGVPASTDDEGLQWDLVPYTQAVDKDGTFKGIIPGWGIGDLVALVSAEVVSSKMINEKLQNVFGTTTNLTYGHYVLKNGTLEEHTEKIDKDTGRVSLSFQSTVNNSSYRLFTFYQKLTLHKNLEFPVTEDKSIFDNGSYIVDHFSGRGAETTTKFWEDYILNDKIKSLLTEVGNYGWEDSIEITSNISWSRSLPDRFQRLKGYNIRPILPLLAFGLNNVGVQSDSPGSFQCLLDTHDQGAGYISDFRSVLEDGYREYLQTLVQWTNTVLGLQFSAQPSYNLPLDMQATIPDVNAPECESLAFSDSIDAYRQFSGPAQLAGKRVISNELGAVIEEAFRYPILSLLFAANRGFVGGVNQYVIHGQAFSGNYYATTWPGYVPWGYLFSETWNQKQPVWEHGFSDALGYLGRTQHVLQTGVPKVDVAFYSKKIDAVVEQILDTTDLVKAGWSYTYISPDNFALPTAVVENGVLAPDGPAWKAFVVDSSQNLTLPTVEKLSEYAAAGLPVLFSNGKPGFYPTGNGQTKAAFSEKLDQLLTQENVHLVSWEGLATELGKLGITPRLATNTNGTLYTAWRESKDAEYALVYSDVSASSGEIVVQTKKTPYWFNAWTGERSPVLRYNQNTSSTTIPISLAANQSAILAFSDSLSGEITTPSFHVTSASSNILGYTVKDGSSIWANVAASTKTVVIRTSTGKQTNLSASHIPGQISLKNWTLIAEHWDAPNNLSEQSVIASKRNTTHQLSELVSWLDIPELSNTSGVGYYTTTFDWPPSGSKSTSDLGAYVTVSKVLHTARVSVNDQRIPALDVFDAVADISSYLVEGKNKIEVEVPTVMWNYLRSIFGSLENAGSAPYLLELVSLITELPGAIDVGLVGEVVVTPFQRVKIGE